MVIEMLPAVVRKETRPVSSAADDHVREATQQQQQPYPSWCLRPSLLSLSPLPPSALATEGAGDSTSGTSRSTVMESGGFKERQSWKVPGGTGVNAAKSTIAAVGRDKGRTILMGITRKRKGMKSSHDLVSRCSPAIILASMIKLLLLMSTAAGAVNAAGRESTAALGNLAVYPSRKLTGSNDSGDRRGSHGRSVGRITDVEGDEAVADVYNRRRRLSEKEDDPSGLRGTSPPRLELQVEEDLPEGDAPENLESKDHDEDGGTQDGSGKEDDKEDLRDQENHESEVDSGLPQCYSSPAADPSRGAWRSSKNGEDDSPMDMVNWSFNKQQFGHATKCTTEWHENHPGGAPRPHYEWAAEDCALQTVDAAKFCKVMEGRKGLLFAGDSLTRLMCTTLASILRAETIVSGSDQRCHDEWSACGGSLKIVFQRNDFLDTRTERRFENNSRGFDQKHCVRPDLSKTRCTIFADDDTLREFDTLVVNSGAHPRTPAKYGPAMEEASQKIGQAMRRLHSGEDDESGDEGPILVVRNTVPGHWECNERMFDEPVDLEVAARLVAAAPEEFKYTEFQEYNRLLEKAFLSSADGRYGSRSRWRLLDSYTPTFLRADSHMGGNGPDCLHYCLPGPTDHWVRLLYNILLVATTEDPLEASRSGRCTDTEACDGGTLGKIGRGRIAMLSAALLTVLLVVTGLVAQHRRRKRIQAESEGGI